MKMYNPDDYVGLALNETSSDASYGEDNPLDMRGLAVMCKAVGSTHAHDMFFHQNLDREMEWNDFRDLLFYVLSIKEAAFRKLVLTIINANGQLFGRISLTWNRILAFSSDIFTGLNLIVFFCITIGMQMCMMNMMVVNQNGLMCMDMK